MDMKMSASLKPLSRDNVRTIGSEEHSKWTNPCYQDLFCRKSLSKGFELIGPIDVGFLAALVSLLGNLIHHNGSPGLWDADEM
jgi:hypothetical protein